MSIGLHPTDAGQVYIGARYDGEVFGTRDAGKTWQAMPLPGQVQPLHSVACGLKGPTTTTRFTPRGFSALSTAPS